MSIHSGNLKVASREEATPTAAVDMVDAAFKINTFLNKHLCLFTQGLTYKNKNIKVCCLSRLASFKAQLLIYDGCSQMPCVIL